MPAVDSLLGANSVTNSLIIYSAVANTQKMMIYVVITWHGVQRYQVINLMTTFD